MGGKFGEFVKEKDAAVGKGDFAGFGKGATADDGMDGSGVMDGAERSFLNKGLMVWEQAGHRIDLGDNQAFI